MTKSFTPGSTRWRTIFWGSLVTGADHVARLMPSACRTRCIIGPRCDPSQSLFDDAASRANSMLTSSPEAKPRPADPTVSVVLPNYNHAKLIGRAVAALQAQKRPPDEILIVEDASTDQSLRVIEELAAGSNIVRVLVNKENQGTIAALSRGLDASGGKYIYFAAADDWTE